MSSPWYKISDSTLLDSPSLLVYPERVRHNVCLAIEMVEGNTHRLQPHIKTCKAAGAIKIMMEEGINKFKCATISEADLLAQSGAAKVLLAYQPTPTKIKRLINLILDFPHIEFSFLIDNIKTSSELSQSFVENNVIGNVYLDINVGMNRTGIIPGEAAVTLYEFCNKQEGLQIKGLHVYDGHIRNPDFKIKMREVEEAFLPVQKMVTNIEESNLPLPELICGGSPSFSVHCKNENVICSPGTFIYWDYGYQMLCPEQNFLPAVCIFTRIISKPKPGLVSIDAGHKAMAAESSLDKRLHFLKDENLQPVSQSEEHMVFQQKGRIEYNIGDDLYCLPYHVCPTVNLYEEIFTIEKGNITGSWRNVARDRIVNY